LRERFPAGTTRAKDFLPDLSDQPVEFRLVQDRSFLRYFPLDIQDLLHARLVASRRRTGLAIQVRKNLFRLGLGQKPGAESKHIRIIMFPAISSGKLYHSIGPRRMPGHLVRRDRGADARAIDRHGRAQPCRRPPAQPP